ncbi:CYTH domain-containing protein [Xenorhabdus szentirmaii]|uniref:CYTH domain-containing protein n=1 Tax=Xenorhabdus szentirmaii TaxID=290112 RepID=UPI0032B6FA45
MLSVEIELKLEVKPDAISAVRQQLFQFPHHYTSLQYLTNIYFETADNQLRRWDMGLRIRGFDGQYEMTMKTAGKVIGGLHQRPEFNVPLSEPVLELAQFPAHIWPENTNLVRLQSQLTELFRTDFTREKWRVNYGQSDIEVVLDQGEIRSGNHADISPICEFELELVSGNVSDILSLATKLASQNGLRLANKSKAARGYALAQDLVQQTVPCVLKEPEWQQSVTGLLSEILKQWQKQEESWLAGLPESKAALSRVLDWVTQLSEKQSGGLPELALLPDLLPELAEALSAADAESGKLCYSALWLRCKLALMQCLVMQSR